MDNECKRSIYMAPMEGVTTYVFRQIFNEYFGGVDKYFTPFISPTINKCYTDKEFKEFDPENNIGMNVVPQVLTNNADLFLKTAKELENIGYKEVNINLGCPSGTVVSKKRGSGFLSEKDMLDEFLDKIYTECKIDVSIKTRIGRFEPKEFEDLLEIYNKYPISELIVHPRTRQDYYKNEPNLEEFDRAYNESKAKVCYNGNIFSIGDYEKIDKRYKIKDKKQVNIMLGRGLVGNPGLADMIKSKKEYDIKYFKEYHDKLYDAYNTILYGDRAKLFKMKELWLYMICIFDNYEKYWKKIKKSNSLQEYKVWIDKMFNEGSINVRSGYEVHK